MSLIGAFRRKITRVEKDGSIYNPYILIILRNNTEYSSTAVLEICMGGVQILVVDGCKIAAMR